MCVLRVLVCYDLVICVFLRLCWCLHDVVVRVLPVRACPRFVGIWCAFLAWDMCGVHVGDFCLCVRFIGMCVHDLCVCK